ncbi:flavodoxin family protein [Photobacterium galatheae]|uniref:Flavodoxin n=1 Tax=Photobacterium galatheae TaxID=1654360 RepID=A0A066RMR6_9GAMM|nr:flavodoxin family protein [Photobacterium galatheae]KDM90426.1 flavodoxin [Photobacterium galatheae]MCM0147854.1 flavodoxin family protein [Photobacterium galatheae]
MKTIALVYYSGSGATHDMAEAVAQGAKTQPDIQVIRYRISGEDIQNGRFNDPDLFASLQHADAILFGSPTYMGGPAAQFKAFADASSESWSEQGWRNKLAAGFTVGGSQGGEQDSTLNYLLILAMQHGMLWVGMDMPSGYHDKRINPMGRQLGASGHTPEGALSEADLKTASHLGQRVATLLLSQFAAEKSPVAEIA